MAADVALEAEAAGHMAPRVECSLDTTAYLVVVLAAMQLREKEKNQTVHCEASLRGLKFVSESAGKDVTVLGWMFDNNFREYKFSAPAETTINLRLPISPLLSCLQIFSDRAALRFHYPAGPNGEMLFVLEEDGALTECRLRTLFEHQAPAHNTFFTAEDGVRSMSVVTPKQAEAWYLALSELESLEAPDVVLRVTLRAAAAPGGESTAAVILRAQTITSDAEVELPHECLDEFKLSPEAAAAGGLSHQYLLTSVLSSCLKAAKDARAVKIRFNSSGVMSIQFILKSRGGQNTQLFTEALVCPLADATFVGGAAKRAFSETQASQPYCDESRVF